MKDKSLLEMTPVDLVKAYIKAKGGDITIIPQFAVDAAIGEIEELLNFLDIESYPEEDLDSELSEQLKIK